LHGLFWISYEVHKLDFLFRMGNKLVLGLKNLEVRNISAMLRHARTGSIWVVWVQEY
jgi:hypothetical protein